MIRASLAPSIATSGIQQYWKGNYEKAFSRLSRAYKWSPELFENSEFQGYLGLCLFRLGRVTESRKYLAGSSEYLAKVKAASQDIRAIQADLHSEIIGVLNELNT